MRAAAGTGEVRGAISSATFSVGIRGYTTLLHGMAREGYRSSRAWEKALEIRDAMRARQDLKENVFTYSVSTALVL